MSIFGSLRVRIYGVAALAGGTALLFGLVLLQSSLRSQDAFDWVGHTQEVIIMLDQVELRLSEAESGLRGYLMSRDASYLAGFEAETADVRALTGKLPLLVSDNPVQETRAIQLASVAAEKIDLMARAVQRTRANPLSSPPDAATRQRGRDMMIAVVQQVAAMQHEERRLLTIRRRKVQTEVEQARALLFYGFPFLMLLIGSLAWLIRGGISRPLANLLDVVTRFGAGDRSARASTIVRSVEFRRLAAAYNDMADHLVIAIDTQEARQQSVEMLSEMAQRLQAIQADGELSAVLGTFIPRLLPGVAGALYVHNHSRNMLFRMSTWGNLQSSPEMFPPGDCWGLRRGKTHLVEQPGADIICAHTAECAAEQRCEPILAGGEVLGLIYIEGTIAGESGFRLSGLMESVALALVNDNLRSRLREQSIRDPLTKLFNRRYMEEALALETGRAERSGAPLSIVMCDVDHFKRFNDSNGHEAGDLLLAAVAGLIQSHFRTGDIVCRYGGEEFTVIAPGASSTLVQERVEALRMAIHDLSVSHEGHKLGPITMSFGIDTWSAGGDRLMNTLLAEADRALFRAKRLGRDCIEIASPNTASANNGLALPHAAALKASA
ncbi:MAG: diguanylate cyclase [Janthinobacterium lividum]